MGEHIDIIYLASKGVFHEFSEDIYFASFLSFIYT